jgi:exopolysaccharide production protein ExoQ
MNPNLASLICALGIAGLFYLDRESSVRPSKALWLPVIWIWIIGSRPVSAWFGVDPGGNVQLEGSPFDAIVFGILLLAAIAVLFVRGKAARTLLTSNWPVLIYFLFCLISVIWAYYPDIAFKRWVKAIGDVAMVMVMVTDPHPVDALKRLYSRVGILLFPASVLLIKYYDALGRGYTADGVPMNTGVTNNKNSLGVILLIVSLGTVWNLLGLLRDKNSPDRRRHLIAQWVLLAFEFALLGMADSKTSISCFALGTGLIVATNSNAMKGRPGRVHAVCLAILLVGGATILFGGGEGVAHALGRQSDFSGRTDIWAALIPAAPNAVIGAGFESFRISPAVRKAYAILLSGGWYHPETLNEAHNGYIEVYLNLGWTGVTLIALILIGGYQRAISAIQRNSRVGGLVLAYIMCSAVYSITEAGFRMLDPIWFFLLFAVVFAPTVPDSSGLAKQAPIQWKHKILAGPSVSSRLAPRTTSA